MKSIEILQILVVLWFTGLMIYAAIRMGSSRNKMFDR